MATEKSIIKRCTKCGMTKPTTEFNKNASKSDGLGTECRNCARIINTNWRAANPEKKKISAAAWYAANSEKHNANRVVSPEKERAYTAKWKAANPEKVRAIKAQWYAANKEAYRIYNHNRRARERENGGQLSTDLAEKLFKLQRGKCACCKQLLGDKFHRDHKMPLALGGENEDWNIQLLCQTCNQQKHAKHPIDFMQQRGFLI